MQLLLAGISCGAFDVRDYDGSVLEFGRNTNLEDKLKDAEM